MNDNAQDFIDSVKALAPGFRLLPEEIGVAMAVLRSDATAADLTSALADIEFLAAHLHRHRRTDVEPIESIAFVVSGATRVDWQKHVLVSLLSSRWNGEGELAIVRTVLNGQIERLKGAAA